MVAKLSDIIGHSQVIKTLKNSINKDRVAHAYLFMGPPGVGKQTVARAYAQVLLCEGHQAGEMCGHCRSCRQVAGGNHPDLHLLQPSGASIKIEQIRELQRQVQYKPYQSLRQVFVIERAEAMTQEAANCFLKTLEEPSGNTVFILLTDQPYSLLPTILSRCQQYQFRPLSKQEITRGLQLCQIDTNDAAKFAALAGGSLGRAFRLANGEEQWPLRVKTLDLVQRLKDMSKYQALVNAEGLSSDKNEAAEALEIMSLWFRDLLVFKYTESKDLLVNQDKINQVVELANLYELPAIMSILQEINLARDKILANANVRATLEVLMLKIHSYGGNYNVH